jgi:hypothetical protein
VHQSLDALSPDPDAPGQAQLGVDAPRAVDTAVGGVDRLDAFGQPRVRERAIARGAGAASHNPERLTPSSPQHMETGVRAFSAEMNR